MQYKWGSVTVTNGSNIVTGDGTLWLTNVAVGDWFKVDDRAPIYQIASVDNNTQVTLTVNYAEASGSGLAYCIVTDFTSRIGAPLIFKGDIDWPDIYNKALTLFDEVAWKKSGGNIYRESGNVGIGTTSPNSTLHNAGSFALPIATQTGTYTLTATDYCILGNADAAPLILNLPTAVGIAGRIYEFVKIDSSANAVTIDPAGAETINGTTTKALSAQWARCRIISDGANWIVLNE